MLQLDILGGWAHGDKELGDVWVYFIFYLFFLFFRPCLLRRAGAIAYHGTSKMITRSGIYHTPKFSYILKNELEITHLQHTWLS